MNYGFVKKLIPCSDSIDEMVVVPDGKVDLVGYPSITMNQEAADRCIKVFTEKGLQLPVDYEHSSVIEANNGKPAPATAWITKLRYEPGRGLVGVLGDRSADFDSLVKSKGYKYLSPVLKQDSDTGVVTEIHSVALTNKPRIKNQKELLAASMRLALADMPDEEEKDKAKPGDSGSGDGFMDAIKKLAESLRGYGVQLPDESPEQVCNAAMQWMVNKNQQTQTTGQFSEKVVSALGLPAKSDETLVLAEVNKLKGHVGYVPAADFKALSDRLTVIETEKKSGEAEAAVTVCLNEGRLNPNDEPQMKWAREFAGKDVAGFKTLMASAPVIHDMCRVTPTPGNGRTDDKNMTREKVIAAAEREYIDEAIPKRCGTKTEWINGSLREHGFELLKAGKN